MGRLTAFIKKLKKTRPVLYRKLLFLSTTVLNSLLFICLINKKKIKGKGNTISCQGALCKSFKVKILGNNNTINIEEESIITNCTVYIKGNNHKLLLTKNNRIQNTEFWFEDNDCTIAIGENTRIFGAHIAVTEPNSKISIGKGCLFSSQIDIRNGDSHSILDKKTNQRINFARDINIRNFVWIGKGATILKGTTIDSNCVIGTKSVVTKDVPPNCIVAGFPAKVVKENIYWKGARIFENGDTNLELPKIS